MTDVFARIIGNLIGRLTGPLTLRLFLQPAMAIFAAVKAGIEDARMDRPFYLLTLVSSPAHRRELLIDGWKDITKVFIAAAVMDVVYQVIALKWVYPGEALLVAFLLAAVPYAVIRGFVNRLARVWLRRSQRA
jgi:hypothetical protein